MAFWRILGQPLQDNQSERLGDQLLGRIDNGEHIMLLRGYIEKPPRKSSLRLRPLGQRGIGEDRQSGFNLLITVCCTILNMVNRFISTKYL